MTNGIIEQMQAEIEELKAKFAEMEKWRSNGKEAPKFTPLSPQELRDEIIEQAKRDVAERFKKDVDGINEVIDGLHGHNRVEFVINKEKRIVVALLRFAYGSDKVITRGIAKCAPSDCFNVHIGKAIALRRALGLEVPAEYLTAPQPTEVRDYDKLRHTSGVIYTVTPTDHYEHAHGTEECQKDAPVVKECTIIDDSRE